MNKHIAAAIGLIAASAMMYGAPALAHGRVQWSATVGSTGYYPPPGVVVYPQSQYIYGAPPSASSVYVPPPVIYYVQPQPVYRVVPRARLNVDSYHYPYHQPYPRHDYRLQARPDHDRYHDRHDWNNRHGGYRWEHWENRR